MATLSALPFALNLMLISTKSGKKCNFRHDYRIYSINRPGRLLNFWTLRVGAYSRLGAY